MNTKLTTYHNMAIGVVLVVTSDEKAYAVPAVKECIDILKSNVEEVDNRLPELSMPRYLNSDGFMSVKQRLQANIKVAADKLMGYASETQKVQLVALAKKGRLDLNRTNQQELEKLASELVREITPIKEEMASFFYTEDDLNTLMDLADSYSQHRNERNLHRFRYGISSAIAKELLHVYKEQLARLQVILTGIAREYPNVAQNVTNILNRPRVVNISAIYATITDEEEMPLTSARMELYNDEDNSLYLDYLSANQIPDSSKQIPQVVKTTTHNGVFMVRTLAAGSYTAFVSMYGYERQVLKVFINPKNTFYLKLQLRKVEVQAALNR